MAKITTTYPGFTGSVGPVHFVNGEASTDLPTMLEHFAADPDRYTVHEDKPKPKPAAKPKPAPAPADQGGQNDQGGAPSDTKATQGD